MKKIFYLLLGAMTFFTACDSDDDFVNPEEQLSPEAEQHLKDYYDGAEIKSVHHWKNDEKPGTAVELEDKAGNAVSIFYKDGKQLSLTVTKFANFENLPLQIKVAFRNSPYGNRNAENINMECDDYAQLPEKMYRFEFTDVEPGIGNLYTQLTFNENGYLLPINHGFANPAWFNPIINEDETDFINHKYGVDIRSYEDLGGTRSYYVMDHEVLKNVRFRNDKWQGTVYPLPLDTDVPEDILKQLYELEPDFKYVKLNRLESPYGDGYQFWNDNGHGISLGDMFVKRSL